jgi:hypothetical protein
MLRSHAFNPCRQLSVRLPAFSCVLADIGDEQSLTANLSKFSGHIKGCVGHVFAFVHLGRRPRVVKIRQASLLSDLAVEISTSSTTVMSGRCLRQSLRGCQPSAVCLQLCAGCQPMPLVVSRV